MHSNTPVSHIALTCPSCGKHYRKVPYEAIKKFRFAFCKQCNTKFQISSEELEKALQQALRGVDPAAPEPCGGREAAAAEPDRGNLHQQEPPAEENRGHGDDSEAAMQPPVAEDLKRKLSDLAATMQDAFSQPAPDAGGGASPSAAADAECPDTSWLNQGEGASAEPVREQAADEPDSAGSTVEISGGALSDAGKAELPSDTAGFETAAGPADACFEQELPAADGLSEALPDLENLQGSLLPQEAAHADMAEGAPTPGPASESEKRQEQQEPPPEFAGDFPERRVNEALFPEEPLSEPAAGWMAEPATAASCYESGFDIPADVGRQQDVLFEESPEIAEGYAPPAEQAAGGGPLPSAAGEPEAAQEEELLDEDLIEDAAGSPPEYAGAAAEQLDSLPEGSWPGAGVAPSELGRPGPELSLFDSLQNPEGHRDVSAMLKQLVLPSDELQEGMEQFVLFNLNDQTYAAPIANIFELSLPPEMIPVPNTPAWILGVSNMRGEIISVIDFKEFLNLEADMFRKPGRMIIAQTRDKQMVIGLLVDSINGIKYFLVDGIQPMQQQDGGFTQAFYQGACVFESEVVIFLDLEKILQSSKMRQFQ